MSGNGGKLEAEAGMGREIDVDMLAVADCASVIKHKVDIVNHIH